MKKCLSLLLAAALCLSLFLLAGCGTGKPVLHVYNWGQYIDPTVITQFEQEYGVRVVYDTFASNEEMYAKIKASGGGYDVLFPSDYMVQRMAREGLLAEINWDNVPNVSFIDERFKSPSYDPDNLYSVPYMWGTVGIAYNKTMITEPVNSWNILWDEDYAGKILMYNSSRDSMMVALRKLGYDINTRDEAEINAAVQALKEQKPLVLAYVEDDVQDKMIAGEAAMAVMYSGDYHEIKGQNPDVEYVIPQEGSNVWTDAMVILKSTKNKELAEKFINFMCRTDIALLNVEEIRYATPHTGALAELDEETRNDKSIYPTDEQLENCDTYEDLGEYTRLYDEAWTQIIAN